MLSCSGDHGLYAVNVIYTQWMMAYKYLRSFKSKNKRRTRFYRRVRYKISLIFTTLNINYKYGTIFLYLGHFVRWETALRHLWLHARLGGRVLVIAADTFGACLSNVNQKKSIITENCVFAFKWPFNYIFTSLELGSSPISDSACLFYGCWWFIDPQRIFSTIHFYIRWHLEIIWL